MLIGFARASTIEQKPQQQQRALTKAGCERIFEDKVSGTRADRPGLTKALEVLRAGDTLVVWKLDRLGRSVKQLVDLVSDLHTQGIEFHSLTDAIDTGTLSGRFFFHVMASLAEMERELTVERTRAGLEAARQQGRKGGYKRKMTTNKNRVSQETASQRHTAEGCVQELGRLHPHPVPLDSCLNQPRTAHGPEGNDRRNRLASSVIRFLNRPLLELVVHDRQFLRGYYVNPYWAFSRR